MREEEEVGSSQSSGAVPSLPPSGDPKQPYCAPWRYVPWHVAEGPSQVRTAEDWLMCEVSSDDYARLIAAAPDMLEALKHILAGALSLPRFAEDEARAAIDRAEGRL